MPSTYSNIGLELIATGEQAGTWGETTNTNLEIIDEASNGRQIITLTSAGSSSSPNEYALTDGAEADFRNKFLEITSATDLSLTTYVRMTPNTAEKVGYIKNTLADGVPLYVFQSDTFNSSTAAYIPNGETHIVTFDGTGTNATCTSEIAPGVFPSGDRDARTAIPSLGQVRYNSADKNLEVYNGRYETGSERWSPLGCWELLDSGPSTNDFIDFINLEDNDATTSDRSQYRYRQYRLVASVYRTGDYNVFFRPIYANQDDGTTFFLNGVSTGIFRATVRGGFGITQSVFRDQTNLDIYPYSTDDFDASDSCTFVMEWGNNSAFSNGPITWTINGAGVSDLATADAEAFDWIGNLRSINDGYNIGWRIELSGGGSPQWQYAFYGLKATD